MARLVALYPNGKYPKLERTEAKDRDFGDCLKVDIENDLSARWAQEVSWREGDRQYASIAKRATRHPTVPEAPLIEIPLGAIACDALYAQMTDTLYAATPLLTARAQSDDWEDHAKAVQRWANYLATCEVNLRNATDHAFADCIQKGTAGFYTPFVEDIRYGRVFQTVDRGPRIVPIAPENILFPGGSTGNVQDDRRVALRFWLTPGEFAIWAARNEWNPELAAPCASIDWVRRQHEHIGLTHSDASWREMYELWCVFSYSDYSHVGQDLDLVTWWDRTTGKVLSVELNRYDQRPLDVMRYQLRPHLAYGLGVLEMAAPFQEETSVIHRHRIVNMMLCNARVWAALDGNVPDGLEIWANRVIPVRDLNAIKELKMGDVYPSSLQAEASATALCERRIGTEGLASASAEPHQNIGTRTPGITALSQLQAQNRRFTPAFDQMRLGAANALRQCLLRYRERLMGGDKQCEDHITEVLGGRDAGLVVDLLKQKDFDRYVAVEFTAVAPQTNKEADRQALVMAAQQMDVYYKEVFQLLAAVSQPGVPPELQQMARDIVQKRGEFQDRFLRTFEQIRDPERLVIDVPDQAAPQQPQGLDGLAQLLGGLLQPPQEGGAPGNGGPPLAS